MKKYIDMKTEAGCKSWVQYNLPILIRPKKVRKYQLVSPFSSMYAFDQIVEDLGKKIFEMLQEAENAKAR